MMKPMQAFPGNPRPINLGLAIVLAWSVLLRSIHFFGRSSMWLDELAGAFNVMERDFHQLATETLDFNQVAPLGFLWMQKLSSLLLGENDHAFRFFPYLCSLLSLVLVVLVARRFLQGLPLLGAVALFGLSFTMFFYGGEGKQYSGDVTASLFLLWSCLKMQEGKLPNGQLWTISLGGAFLIFCSMPAVVIAPLSLFFIFLQLLRGRIGLPVKQFTLVAVSWAITCLLLTAYATLVISPDTRHAMGDYWSRGFAPLTGVMDFITWIPLRIHRECTFVLAWYMTDMVPQLGYIAWVLMALSVPGLWWLWKEKGIGVLVLLTPLFTGLLLSIFRVLPLDGRVSIYVTWPLMITGMAGIQALMVWWPRVFSPTFSSAITLPIGLHMGLLVLFTPLAHPPVNGQSAQPVLRELKKQLQPGDILYVYFKSSYALRFYGPREGITEYVAGKNHAKIEPLLRDIDSLRGNKRVWFFYTQWTPRQPFPDSVKAYMGTVIGKQLGVIPDPDGNTGESEAAAYLYDLSGEQPR